MFFPLFLILSVLLRNFVLPTCTCLFTPEHLEALDGEHNDNEYKARTGDPLIGSDRIAGAMPITPEDISTFPATSPSPVEGPNGNMATPGSDSPPLRFAEGVDGPQTVGLLGKKRSSMLLRLQQTSDDYDEDLGDEGSTEPGLIRGRDSELSLSEMGPLYISASPHKWPTASDRQQHNDSASHLELPHNRSRPVSISIGQLEHHPPHQLVPPEAMSLVAFQLGEPEPAPDALQPLLNSESTAATPSDHEELDFYEQAHMPM